MSFFEIIVILFVALIVIKPERLPEISYILGKWVAKAQKLYKQFLANQNLS